MSNVITKGGNATVRGGRLTISATPAGIDLTVLCLRADGKVGGDEDFVFYNQPVSPDGAVRLTGGRIEMELPVVAAGIERFVFSASVDTGTFGGVAVNVRITEGDGHVHELPVTGLTTETTVILAEVYRRAGAWKIRHVGQGYATGLSGPATDLGITVDDAPAAPPPLPAAAPVPPPPGVDFSKGTVTLTKGDGPVLLEKAPLVRLRVAWASGTDYEAYALVVLTSGEVVHIATFPAATGPAFVDEQPGAATYSNSEYCNLCMD